MAAVDGTIAQLALVDEPAKKIVELGSRLARLKELVDRGEADVADGRYESAERAFTAALRLRDQRRLWGPGSASTTRVLKKYATKMLGRMYEEGLPLSQRFKQNMGPQFESSDEEASEDEVEEELEVEEEAEKELDSYREVAEALDGEEAVDLLAEAAE